MLVTLTVASCSHDNGRHNEGNKDNDNRGNHSTDPAVPSDAEYPGSKLNDSVYKADSTKHH